MQAKSARQPRTGALKGKEAHQFSLYANWATPFSFPHNEFGPPGDNSEQWDFSRGPMPMLDSSGIYGIVANVRPDASLSMFPGGCAWSAGQALPTPPGGRMSVDASDMSLADVLEGFLLGTQGRPWDIRAAGTDHWSTFVRRALVAAESWKPYPVQRRGENALPRRRDVMAFVHDFNDTPFSPGLIDYEALSLETRKAAYKVLLQDDIDKTTKAWKQGLPDYGDQREPPAPPADDLWGTPSSPGISVLYLGTFGDGALPPHADEPDGPHLTSVSLREEFA